MNIYDTKMVICANCKKSISKVDFNAMIIHPLYGQCANPMPEGDGTLQDGIKINL